MLRCRSRIWRSTTRGHLHLRRQYRMRICPRRWVCNRSTVVVFRLLGFPHVADFATLAVNKGLLKLQPLARLYARLLYKCNESITSDINRASGYRHHAALSPERRDPEGESRRDLAVGERSVTHGMNRKEIMRLLSMLKSK